MAKKGGGRRAGGGGRRSVKGFRPGKEPAQLKKQMVKAQLGRDASWAQKQAVETVAGRTPQQVESMVRRWTLVVAVVAATLVVAGALLYTWSAAAGIGVHVLALALGFLALRLRKHGQGLVDMARSLQ